MPARIELASPSRHSRLITSVPEECRSSGASSSAPAPSTTMRALPVISAARVTTVCSSGRPPRRTSCFGDPKRVEAPAASTMAWRPSASLALAADVGMSGEGRDGAGRQMLLHPLVAAALLENRVGVDAADDAPVGNPRVG
jgi:hypothetical protein